MKKMLIVLFAFTAVVAKATGRVEINEQILKSFNQTFIYAQDVQWDEKDNVYQANFWQGEINIRAKYDEQGNLLGTIRYYFEKQLPPNVVSKIKRKYPGKFIYGVTEVSSDDEVNFFVTLQDEKNWYTVKSDIYGHLEQTEKFKRADAE